MRYLDILKQSWQILWHYRLLWIFGFVLALTTFPWQGSIDWSDEWNSNRGTIVRTDEDTLTFPGFDATVDVEDNGVITIRPRGGGEPTVIHTKGGLTIQFPDGVEKDFHELADYLTYSIPADVSEIVVGSLVTIAVVVLGVVVVANLLRYPAEVALISAVDENAMSKKKASFRELVRMGWSKNAWRFFLIDVAVRLPLLVIFAVLFALALSPFVLALDSDANGWIVGFLASAVLLAGTLILAAITSIIIGHFMHFFRRACAIEGLGVTASVVRGFQVIFRNLKEVIVMTFAMIVVQIGWMVAAVPLLVLMIPLFLVFVVIGGLAAVAVLFPSAWLASLALNEVVAWVVGGSLALVVFLPIVTAPFTFLSGLFAVYKSSTWTLTYRELLALESAKAAAKVEGKQALVNA